MLLLEFADSVVELNTTFIQWLVEPNGYSVQAFIKIKWDKIDNFFLVLILHREYEKCHKYESWRQSHSLLPRTRRFYCICIHSCSMLFLTSRSGKRISAIFLHTAGYPIFTVFLCSAPESVTTQNRTLTQNTEPYFLNTIDDGLLSRCCRPSSESSRLRDGKKLGKACARAQKCVIIFNYIIYVITQLCCLLNVIISSSYAHSLVTFFLRL